jgi:hypothetical protein
MKFMVAWKIPAGSHKPAAEIFLRSGAPVPAGLELVGRWHAPGSAYGWALVEGNDTTALAQHMAEWANYLEMQVTPVIEDAEAGAGMSKAYGK